MPQNWKTYKLGKIAKLRKKTVQPKDFNGEKYIGLEHIGQGDFLLNGIGVASDVTSNKFKFKSGDILYGKIRPYFKKVYKTQFSGICSTDILIITSSSEEVVTQEYLYQLIKTQTFTDKAVETSSGTKMPRADWNSLEQVEFAFPPLIEQKSIASILSALDDKIELNLQMNKTLEEMAMALYKHWFVEFGPFQDGEFVDSELGEIPKGWEVKLLNELGNIFYGKMPKKDKLQNEGFPVYSGYRNVGFYPIYNCDKGKIIVVARGVGGTGDVKMTVEKCFLTNLSICINNELGYIDDNLLFFGLKRIGLDYLRTGSAQPQITINDLNKVSVLIPSKNIQAEFMSSFSLLLLEMENNQKENETLTQLRDTLLPKLISGEVRVKDVEKIVTEVI